MICCIFLQESILFIQQEVLKVAKSASNRIKEVREIRKISQKDLAQQLKTSQQAISLYEKGIREPKIEMWEKIAHVLRVTIPYLQGISYDEDDILLFINSNYFDHALGSNAPYTDKLTFELRKYFETIGKPMPETKFTIEELAGFTDDVKRYWRENLGFIFKEEPYKSYLLNSDLSKTEILNIVTDAIETKKLRITETPISKAFDDICNNDLYFWKNNKDNLIRFASKSDIQGAINHLQQSLNAFSDKLKDLPENKDITFKFPNGLKATDNDKHQ